MALNFPAEPEINDLHSVGDTTWRWDGTAWNVVAGVTAPAAVFTFRNINVDDATTLSAESLTDTLNIIAGSNISLTGNAETDTITITSTAEGGGGGGDVTQNLFETFSVGGTDITAASPTDSITFIAGSNITLSANASTNQITIGNALSVPPDSFTDLADGANLTVDTLAYPAIAMYTVTNSGSAAYLFNSHYSGSNPTIYAISATTIAFNLNVPGHPFEIQTPAGNPYNTGLVHVSTDGTISTGEDAQGKTSGTLYWQIPLSISGTYRYQCQLHAAMVGGVSIKSFIAI
jgi:hypothetical protein